MVPDFVVWSADGSQAGLIVLIGGWDVNNPERDNRQRTRTHRELAEYMKRIGCRHALIVNRAKSLIVRRESMDATTEGLTEGVVVPTALLLGEKRQSASDLPVSADQLDQLVKSWLERLIVSGAEALPEDRATQEAFASGITEATRGGRVVWEMVQECKRRLASNGPWYTGEQVRATLQALEAEWQRTGGFDETYMHAFLEELRSGGPR